MCKYRTDFPRIVSKISHLDSWSIAYQESHIGSSRDDWVQNQMQIQSRSQDRALSLGSHWDGWVLLPWSRSNQSVCISCIRLHHRTDKRSLPRLLAQQKGSIQVAYGSPPLCRRYQRAWSRSWTSDDWYRFTYLRQFTLPDRMYYHG